MASLTKYHVSVGLIVRNGYLLINSRTADRIQSGFWEFPGGKIEPNETPEAALCRELQEEIGITPTKYRFLLTHHYEYPSHSVDLELFCVSEFLGEPKPLEGQELAWITRDTFARYNFLAANQELVKHPQVVALAEWKFSI